MEINLNDLKSNLFGVQNPSDGILSPEQSLCYRVIKPKFSTTTKAGKVGELLGGQDYTFSYELEVSLAVTKGSETLVKDKDYTLLEKQHADYTEITFTPLLKPNSKTVLSISPSAKVHLNGTVVSHSLPALPLTILPVSTDPFFQSFLVDSNSTDVLQVGESLVASVKHSLVDLPVDPVFPISSSLLLSGILTPFNIYSVQWEAYEKPLASATVAGTSTTEPKKLVEGKDFIAPKGMDTLHSQVLFKPREKSYLAYLVAKISCDCNGIPVSAPKQLVLTTATTLVKGLEDILADINKGFDQVPHSLNTLEAGEPLHLQMIHNKLDLTHTFGTFILGALEFPWKLTNISWKLVKEPYSSSETAIELIPDQDYFLSDGETPFQQTLHIRPSIVENRNSIKNPYSYKLTTTISYLFNGLPQTKVIEHTVKQWPIGVDQINDMFSFIGSKTGSLQPGENVVVRIETPFSLLPELPLLHNDREDTIVPEAVNWFPLKGTLPFGELEIPLKISDITWKVEKGTATLQEGKDYFLDNNDNPLEQILMIKPEMVESIQQATAQEYRVSAVIKYMISNIPHTLTLPLNIRQLPIVKDFVRSLFQVKSSRTGLVRLGETMAVLLTTPLTALPMNSEQTSSFTLPSVPAWFPLTGTLPFGELQLPLEIKSVEWIVTGERENADGVVKTVDMKEDVDFKSPEGVNGLSTSFLFMPPATWNPTAAVPMKRFVKAVITATFNGQELTFPDLPALEVLVQPFDVLPHVQTIIDQVVQSIRIEQNLTRLEPGVPLLANIASDLFDAGALTQSFSQSGENATTPDILSGTFSLLTDKLPFPIPVPFSLSVNWALKKKQEDGSFVDLAEEEYHVRLNEGVTSYTRENILASLSKSELGVFLTPTVKGYHQLAEVDVRYLEATVKLKINHSADSKLNRAISLPKVPIVQVPIAVPEMFVAFEHKLDDETGDKLVVLPESTIAGLDKWAKISKVLETLQTHIFFLLNEYNKVNRTTRFILQMNSLTKGIGKILKKVQGNGILVVLAKDDGIKDVNKFHKIDHDGIWIGDDDKWGSEISAFVALLPTNRKVTLWEGTDYQGDSMDIIPSNAISADHSLFPENLVCIVSNLRVDNLEPDPKGTLKGKVRNDETSSLNFLNFRSGEVATPAVTNDTDEASTQYAGVTG